MFDGELAELLLGVGCCVLEFGDGGFELFYGIGELPDLVFSFSQLFFLVEQ